MSNTRGTRDIFFTEEQFKYLTSLFPVQEVSPSITLEHIMYQAGSQKVIEMVAKRVQGLRRERIED